MLAAGGGRQAALVAQLTTPSIDLIHGGSYSPVIIFQINGAVDRNNICININPERTNGHKL